MPIPLHELSPPGGWYGRLYVEVESNRKIQTLREGDNGVVCRYLDTGQVFSCNVEDFFLWNRFKEVSH